MELCTTAEYKAWRNLTGTDWDTSIALLATIATREVESLCGRTEGGFGSATFTETFDGDGSQTLRVSNGPIASITSIKIGNSDQITLESSTYAHDGKQTISRVPLDQSWGVRADEWGERLNTSSKSPSFSKGFQNVEVVYVAGYATIPANLQLAAFRLIDHYMDSRGNDFEKVSQAIGNGNFTVRATQEYKDRLATLISQWRAIR